MKTIIQGFKYSRKKFKGYTHRMTISIHTNKGWFKGIDVYTTNVDSHNVWAALMSLKSESANFINIETWKTREQDEENEKMINELFYINII